MSELRIENSDYVYYVLQRGNEVTYIMDREPEGWQDDELEIVRDKKYHGIITEFTGGLSFRGRAKDFINDTYRIFGINADLYLSRFKLRSGESYVVGDTIDTIKFKQQYRGIADFATKKEKNGAVTLNFNSKELEVLLESYQSDEFSLSRLKDLNNNQLSDYYSNKTSIKGRDLSGKGYAENAFQSQSDFQDFNNVGDLISNQFTIPTIFGVKGFGRHVEVTDMLFDQNSSLGWQSNFFYNDSLTQGEVITESSLKVSLDINVTVNWGYDINTGNPGYRAKLVIYNFNESTEEYTIAREDVIPPVGGTPITGYLDPGVPFVYNGDFTFATGITNYWAMAVVFYCEGFSVINPPNAGKFTPRYSVSKYKIDVKETSSYNSNTPYRFAFVNELASRLTEIITGKQKKFYSRVFGRANEDFPSTSSGNPPQYQDYQYPVSGEWSQIGLINGFNLRDFSQTNPLYKNITFSLKKLIDSLSSTFNIGVGVEASNEGQRLRFEPLDHYYRRTVVIKLPNQIQEVSREVDDKMFNSSGKFGNEKAGEYEYQLGLDEPNIISDYVFPIKKTTNKFTKVTSIRSDETGMELSRRQPQFLDETADAKGDNDIWFLDLKYNTEENIYNQLEWEDALAYEPIGIESPDTYHNWRFTPKRSMFRHGWVLRSGMNEEVNLNKLVSLSSSTANVNLQTEYLPNVAPREQSGNVREGEPFDVRRFDTPILKPEIITFTHPVNDELMNLILGTTEVLIDGEVEEVPNWYFKFEFINENEEAETGYLISLKPKSGNFSFYKANETI